MVQDAEGTWSVTTEPLDPNLYGYHFLADGVALTDPSDPNLKPNLFNAENMVRITASGLPWEITNVPHGTVHRHFYPSAVAGDTRDYYVYTPPQYDAGRKSGYPVLYLLHGFSDDASGWTSVGQAHVILDNLIAQGKAKPMIVVMPLGYGTREIVERKWDAFRDDNVRQRNFEKFREALLTEVMPRVEKEYKISSKRQDRAIAGLSMGGAESLLTGLNNLDKFAWIGAFSSGGLTPDFAREFPSLDTKDNARIKLLWIACGKDDGLIGINRELSSWLHEKNVRFTQIETPGAHTWMVWRRNLAELTPLLFR
jgi:enterochelin esterase family protein